MALGLGDPGGKPRHVASPFRAPQNHRGLATDHAVRFERAGPLEGRDLLPQVLIVRSATLHRQTGPAHPGHAPPQPVGGGARAPRRTGNSPDGGRQRTTKAPSQNGSTSVSSAVTTRSPKRSVASDGVSAVRTA